MDPPDAQPDAGAPQVPEPEDLGPPGAMCRQYLRAPSVVVEIDWQRGAEPTAAARQHLVGILRQATQSDVTLAGGSEIPGEAEVSSPDSLRALAAAHRDNFSTRDRAAMYVLSVRGRFQEESALGVAYRASEYAIFPDLIGGLSALLGGRTAIERAVLVHEAGHLLCLVNIGYTSAFDREDPEHPKHSSDRSSAMHWAIETSAVAQLFSGPPPDSFTAQDLADLEGLRTGRY